MKQENWRGIEGFPFYEVSDLGNVRNLGGYFVKCGPGIGCRMVPAKTLKPFIVKSTGYLQVLLPDRKKHSVHRLVAGAFHKRGSDSLEVNHINGIKTDNRAENLEWVTRSYNLRHPKLVLGKRNAAFGRRGEQSNKFSPVILTSLITGEKRRFACGSDAVRELGLDSGQISRCAHGKCKSTKGWRVEFAPKGVQWSPASIAQDLNAMEQA